MSFSDSKKQLDDANMEMLSARLGSHWRPLARKLGFHDGDLDRIEYDNRVSGLSEIIWKMLYEYREKRCEQEKHWHLRGGARLSSPRSRSWVKTR